MTEIELWFNPRCSKCRAARDILDEEGVPYRLYPYLEEPPTYAELESVLQKLGTDDPSVMMRTKDEAWQRLGLDSADRERRLHAMREEPSLIERPIAVKGDRAVIARPPERVRELL